MQPAACVNISPGRWPLSSDDGGIAAICARSLHLTQRQFPPVEPLRSSGEGSALFEHLQAILERQRPRVAPRAAVAVLTTIGELLDSFIGESLTTHLLREAWPDDFAGDSSQETPPSMSGKVSIQRLPSGIPGLDAVLGGGVPEFSFNLIAGSPGAGKTTLVQQMMFALARPDRRALFFTVLGEPPLKMLRYQQQFAFFDVAKINESVRFINLSEEVRSGGLAVVLKRIVKEVEATSPAIVIVDSFRSVIQVARRQKGKLDLQEFVQDLGVRLTGWQATTFLVGDFLTGTEDHPIFTVADGLVWLYQSLDRNSMVRKMQVMKMRGQAPIPGLHTFRITGERSSGISASGLQPIGHDGRHRQDEASIATAIASACRLSTRCWAAAFLPDTSMLVAGPSGSGKTVLASQFILEGTRRGEPGIMAVFEKRPERILTTWRGGLAEAVRDGQVEHHPARARWISRSTRRCTS